MTELRWYSNVVQAQQNKIIKYEVDQGYNDVSTGHLGCMLLERLIPKYPKPLQQIVGRPADGVAYNCCPPKTLVLAPVQIMKEIAVQIEQQAVANPKINAAANQVFDELDYELCLPFSQLCHLAYALSQV